MRRIILLIIISLTMISVSFRCRAVERIGRLFSDPVVVAGNYTGFCQDKEGFIWIGSNRGLLRFDGNTYDLYRHDDSSTGSLSDSRILGVMCDSKGRVWVATANGLNLYRSSSDDFLTIALPSEDFFGYIIGLAEQSDGTVTFVVSGVGIYVVSDDAGYPVAVKYYSGDMEKDVNTRPSGPNGRIYMGTNNGRLNVMAPNGTINTVNVSDGDYIQALAMESDGNVLVSTLSDLYRLDSSSGKLSHLNVEGLISIESLSNLAGTEVYIATSGQGLWRIAAGDDTALKCTDIYSPFINIDTARIGSVYNAPGGTLWLGCDYRGIVMVPQKSIPFIYRKLDAYYPDFEGGFSALGMWNGNVIACLDKGRILMLDQSGKVVMSAVVPGADRITHIEVMDGDKAIISVVDNGLWQLDLRSGKVSKYLDIPGKYTYLFTSRGLPGELFVGVHGIGLMRYDESTGEKEWIPYKSAGNTFTNPYVTCLTRSGDRLWIGLFSGIACYDLKHNRMIEIEQDPFLKGATFAIVPCLTDSSVWVGTSHGLIHFDPGKGVIEKFTTKNGLSDNDIRGIVRDHKGGKWIATMHGLSYVPADNDTILSYYGGNGLVETSFNHIGFSREDNRIYMGSDLGITSFVPDSLPAPGFGSGVKVSAVFINGKRIAPYANKKGCEGVPGDGGCLMALKLPYRDNALTFRLSMMDYRDASNVRYMWRLSKKEQWITGPPGENTINLPHLDPGTYDLEICALENNVTSPVKRIRIEISSPWYLTVWAKMVYLAIFLSMAALAFIVFKKKKEEEANEDKIKFFMDVSHDIRSPMTLIMSPLETMLKENHDPGITAKLNVMHRNAQRVMNLVNQLLDIRKLDKGKMRLACRKTDVKAFVGELVELFRPQAADKGQTLSMTELCDPGEVWLDRDNFDKIMVNLISNAIKYTPDGGKIDVAVDTVTDGTLGRCLKVSVTDTGIGLDDKALSKMFEPFYRVRESHAAATMGFGIGLDLCRRIVELHHGAISAANRSDGVKGSVFTVLIPLDEGAYAEGELIEGTAAGSDAGKHLMVAGASPAGDLPSRSAPATAGNKILVIDDDSELRGYIASLLGRYYKVKEASDGVEALKIVADWKPDIVVSDVVMPEMDGLTLLKRLKANTETSHIPVVLLSSKTAVADRMAGWDKGADGYLGKPFNTEELEALVDTLIENRLRMKGKYSGAQDTEGKIDAPEMKGNDEVLLDRIMKEINAHIDDPDLNVERLSSEVGVSRAHLHRKMKDLIGMTPSDYIRNIRLKRACELLKRPDIEVTQVAYRIGFTSQPHFSSHFKRYTGFTPSEYREKCLAGAAPDVKI